MKLIISSNSAPRWQDGVGLLPRSPGGLVPLLVTLLEEHGGDWVCTWPTGTPDRLDAGASEPMPLAGGATLHPVHLPEPIAEQHYLTIGVRLMLWLFHYLFDTSDQPVFDEDFARAWAGYERANRAHADRLAALMTNSPDELVLINDYHLFLVPEMLCLPPARRGHVAFFHGLPWCEPDYFGILPAHLRDRILASLLRCDTIGFHSGRWARAFIACCARFLPCEVDDDGVIFEGRRTRISVASFPLDVEAVSRMLDAPATAGWQDTLSWIRDGRRMLARADRIDLWKNLPRGFAAYRSVLERNPDLAGDWWFCAVVTPPRRTTERSREHHQVCEEMVKDINARFGTPGRPAVSLIYPDPDRSRNCVVAALSGADVTLVNPTYDGMNLVAKEALFLGQRGPLLLSVNAGAYEQLAGYVTPVEPFDVAATASVLLDAMRRPELPARQAAGRLALRGQSATDWLRQLTDVRSEG